MRRLLVIGSLLGRAAWRGFRGSGMTAWVSVVTISVALFLVGAFYLVVVNMDGLLERFGQDLTVTAYLEDDLTPEEIAKRSVDRFNELATAKYMAGQNEHGGCLVDKVCLAHMEEEVLDIWHYLQALKIRLGE